MLIPVNVEALFFNLFKKKKDISKFTSPAIKKTLFNRNKIKLKIVILDTYATRIQLKAQNCIRLIQL